jgi:hypothetical protein
MRRLRLVPVLIALVLVAAPFARAAQNLPRLATTPNGGWQAFFENVATLPLDASSTFVRFYGSGNDARLTPIQKDLEDVKNGTIKVLSDLNR